MKRLFIVLFLFLSFGSMADCNYYSEKEEFLYAGYPINFSKALVNIIESKGFKRVYNIEDADYIFKAALEQKNGRFLKRAQSNLELVEVSTDEVHWQATYFKRCIYMNCSVYDMGKALSKAFQQGEKGLKACPHHL